MGKTPRGPLPRLLVKKTSAKKLVAPRNKAAPRVALTVAASSRGMTYARGKFISNFFSFYLF